MKLRKLTLFIFLALPFSLFAQNADSITFVNAKWNKKKVKNKVHFYSHHFNEKNLFNSNQNVSYVEIKKGCNAPKFQIAYVRNNKVTTSDFGKQHNAVAGINGSFFDVKNGVSVNYLRINGVVIDTNAMRSQNVREDKALAVVGVDKKGRLHVAKLSQETNWENGFDWPDMLASGPMLINNKISETFINEKFNTSRHPRTAVGVKANGNVILLTIDGRNTNAHGASMWELQKIMRWLGCVNAMNLDGGGSTTLWIRGFTENGVVNYPSDNKLWDHAGERKVVNAILVK